MLKKIGVKNIALTTDPTILYPFEKKLNLNIQENQEMNQIKEIGLGIVDRNLAEKIKQILSEIGNYKVENLFTKRNKDFNYFTDELNLYSKFDIFITDRFHRSIFSLKLSNALTIYIENQKFNKFDNSKGRDLLERIGLSQNIITMNSNNILNISQHLNNHISSWNNTKRKEQKLLLGQFIEKNQRNFNELLEKTIK